MRGRRGPEAPAAAAAGPRAAAPDRSFLRLPAFRRLLGARLAGQLGDGVFQAAVAGTVLFDPQSASRPLDVAAGFAVLLLPYSLVGPFAGVWLDRWSRRRVLVVANLVRALLVAGVAGLVAAGRLGVVFYVAGLAVVAVSRFVLSALSASLPHTVDEAALVPANALSTTSGAVAAVVGGGTALLVGDLGSTGAYAPLAVAAAVPYLAAAAVAARFGGAALGPDAGTSAPVAASVRGVAAGLRDGVRHVRARPAAAAALATITLQRVWSGLLTLMALLLYRGPFSADGGLFPGGVGGLGEVLVAGGVGTVLAAVVTPWAVRRAGRRAWTGWVLVGAGVLQLVLGAPFRPAGVVAAGLVLGFAGQAVKVCVDSTLQLEVDDDVRGRVFSVYDTLFNVAYVLALLVGAAVLPRSGVSLPVLLAVAAGYLLTALLGGAGP